MTDPKQTHAEGDAHGGLDEAARGDGAPDSGLTRPVPGWHLHRRMYDWVLSLAHHRHATTSLFWLSFAESSVFPIPPDVLQVALTLERRDRAWWFAAVSTAGSVLGALLGYLLGVLAWQTVDRFFFEHVPGFTEEHFQTVERWYNDNAFLTILTAAFTLIPYKVFTVTAGVFGVSWLTLIVASVVGRAGRFFLVAALIWKFGPPAKRFIDKYFNVLTLGFIVLVIAAVVVVQSIRGGHGEDAGAAGPTPAQPDR